MSRSKRIPEKVKDQLEDGEDIELADGQELYPSKVEFAGNGVILRNSRRSLVFQYGEMLEILEGEHERYEVIV